RLVDALVATDTERRLAESAAHMPLRAGVPVPHGVRRATEVRAMAVDYVKVAAEMERIQPWLRAWAGMWAGRSSSAPRGGWGAAPVPRRAVVPVPHGVRRATEVRAMAVDYVKVAAEMERIQPWLRAWAGM